ncbi:MAG: alpha/beta hydrolase [Planctomycetota bacterium]
MPLLLIGASVAAGLAAVVLIALQLGINRSVKRMLEQAPPLHAVENDPVSDAEPFSFTTEDGLILQGALHPPTDQSPRGLVLFFHELGGDQWSASSYCQGLLDAGFAVASFAFRNHGTSDRMDDYESLHWLSHHELLDIRALIAHLESRADLASLPWIAFGVSRGGGASLIAAAECSRIRGVICESAYSTTSLMSAFSRRWVELFVPRWASRLIPTWHVELSLTGGRVYSELQRRVRYLHVERFVTDLRERPVLLISGERDSYVTPNVADALQKTVGSSSDLWMVPGARHNRSRAIDPQQYDARLVDFVNQLVGLEDRDEVTADSHTAQDATITQG